MPASTVFQDSPFVHIASRAQVESLIARATGYAFAVGTMNGNIETPVQFFDEINQALRFRYFGKNLDALRDCLRSMDEHWPAPGYLLVVRGPQTLWDRDPAFIHRIIKLWISMAEEVEPQDPVRVEGKPLYPLHLVWEWIE